MAVGGIPGLVLGYGTSKLLERFGRKKTAAPTSNPRAAMIARLTGETTGPLDQSASYQAGLGQLRQQATDAAAADAGVLARRGMAGGEAELAARAARGQALAAGQANLVQTAASERMQKLQMLADLSTQMNAEKLAEQQRRASDWGTAGNLLGQAATAYLNYKGMQTKK